VLAQRKPQNPERYQSFLVGPTIIKGEKANSVNRNKIGSMGFVSICNEIFEGEVSPEIKEFPGLDHQKPAALETKARAFADRGKDSNG
jgi:hypothetical protein